MSYSALPNLFGTPDPIAANAGGALNSATVVSAFTNVSVAGILEEDSFYTFAVSGVAGNTFPMAMVNDVGMAVSMDVTAPTTVKLCAANDIILGQLKTLEYRAMEGIVVGAVCTEGGVVLPFDFSVPANIPAVGDSVQGGTVPGTVMKLAAAHGRSNVVTAVDTVKHFVTVLFL